MDPRYHPFPPVPEPPDRSQFGFYVLHGNMQHPPLMRNGEPHAGVVQHMQALPPMHPWVPSVQNPGNYANHQPGYVFPGPNWIREHASPTPTYPDQYSEWSTIPSPTLYQNTPPEKERSPSEESGSRKLPRTKSDLQEERDELVGAENTEFAKMFRQERERLKVSQTEVGRTLRKPDDEDILPFSQTTVSRFESRNMTKKNMDILRPIFKRWLEERYAMERKKQESGVSEATSTERDDYAHYGHY